MPSPRLDYITFKGFKSFASIEKLPLHPINVLIGPNGSGKSNFIGVFAFLNAIREGRLQEYVAKAGGAEKVLHFGSKTTKVMEIHISFQDAGTQYKIELSSAPGDQLYPFRETVLFWDKKYPQPHDQGLSPNGREAGISNPNAKSTASYVRSHLQSWRPYHFHDTSAGSPMKKTASLNDNRFLRPDGLNLAAFLYFLREKHPEAYGLIRERFSELRRSSMIFSWSPRD